jgi:hypothetical protein
MTLFSLPTLLYSIQTVPEDLKKLISYIKCIFDNNELEDIINKDIKYEELRFVRALYFIATNDHKSARDTLEIINDKIGIDDDLKLRTRYRLGIEYRAEKECKKSIKMFSSIPDGSWHKDFGLSTTEFVLKLRSENFEEFKVKIKQNCPNNILEIYKKFQELTEKNKDALSIQCLGAEFSAFVLLKYKLDSVSSGSSDKNDGISEKGLYELFIDSFKETSRISEQQIGTSKDNSIECIWHYVYALIIAQAAILLKREVGNEDEKSIKKIIKGITQEYDNNNEKEGHKVLYHVKRVQTLIPKTDTFFSEMRQCNIGKGEFRKEFKDFLKVLAENVFTEPELKKQFEEIRKGC